jgi:energy-coupling factor transporter ATP-binding protein EcfA2
VSTPSLNSIDAIVEQYLPGERRRIAGGWATTCPDCKTPFSFYIREMYGGTTVACFTAGCAGSFAQGLGLGEAEWQSILDEAPTGTPAVTEGKGGDKGKNDARFSADDVVTFMEANYRPLRSTDGLSFAVGTYPGATRIAREIKSLRSEVLLRFRKYRKQETGKGVVIGNETLNAALSLFAALAETSTAPPETVALRAAQVGDDRVVLDLGDATGRVVEITPSGWSVTEPSESTPLFRRSAATQPLPVPERGGSMDVLRELLGLEATDRRWMLVRGWLVGSLFSEVPRPLLWATGPQGSGKSTRARMVLSLVEPTDALGKEPGRNERDDSTAARARYLVSYDNITTVSQNTSDWLCRLVTGVTDDRRALYSDDDLRPVAYRRSGVATSITLPPGLGSDALERIALVPLDRVPDDERRGESGIWSAFAAERPKLLGALLDDVVLVLRNLATVRGERRSLPRMADYGAILAALDRGLRLNDDAGHLAAYVGTVDESLAERAMDDPFTAAVLALVEGQHGHWRGKAEDLLPLINKSAIEFDLPAWWPRSPRALTGQLEKASEALRHAGVVFRKGKSNGARFVKLTGTVSLPTVPAGGTATPLTVPE